MTHTGVGARGRHTWRQAQSTRPVALPSLCSPSLPAAQAFQEGLVVQEHLEDPEGEKKSSDPEESSAPSRGQRCEDGQASGCWRMRGGAEETSDTPAGPAARSCPSKVPEHPGWE